MNALPTFPNRKPADLISDMSNGAQRLESLVTAWRTFPPRPAGFQDVENVLEGMRRCLVELREASAK